jgi:plasmid stabilization system protein ParE
MERVAEIGAYIHRENPDAAEKWIRKLFDRVKQLEKFPQSGRRTPETKRADIRELVWGNYRTIYRRKARTVAILTVRHVKQILPIDELE